tara:strand:- start:220 stop:645 length:426 start_codon:yes stop_codon:yes gene_type:complete
MDSNQSNQDNTPLRILATHPDTGTLRLIRDSISNLLNIDVDTSPSSEYAFELAVKRHYSLFLFGLEMPNLNGQLLYDMLYLIYPKIHPNNLSFPAVIYIGNDNEIGRSDEIKKDARVKDFLIRPLSIERLVRTINSSLQID